MSTEKLAAVTREPHVGFAYDIDGFVRGPDELVNTAILRRLAVLAREGCVLASVSGLGERAALLHHRPLSRHLEALRLQPEKTPVLSSTRNGSLTTHAYTGEIIDARPLTDEMVSEIVFHPLAQAMQRLTSPIDARKIWEDYHQITTHLNSRINPRFEENMAVKYDFHPPTGLSYQLSLFYRRRYIESVLDNPDYRSPVDTLMEYSDGVLPKNPAHMSKILLAAFKERGLPVHALTARNHADIDISLASKADGCAAVLPQIAGTWGISLQQARERSVGGGDSPDENDADLISFYGRGVTNVETTADIPGLVVLAYPHLPEGPERTHNFLKLFRVG